MNVYLDTSVMVALIVRERGWETTTGWLAQHAASLFWSSFGWGELTDTVARRVRRDMLSPHAGAATLQVARASFARWTQIATIDDDVRGATAAIASDLSRTLKLPDAIHIAIARRVGATLVTHDRAQATAARALGIDTVNPLEESA